MEIYSPKDFVSNQEVKWCPGCGDYSILKQVQSILPEIGTPKEKIVFVSGIGCSSRFPYYMNTYGMHSIHGRAPAIATGIKIANPELNVWVITGDGDGLSIGGNHLIHLFRRNVDVNILLFNNEIYGLTKGQYSPTSAIGLKTKSSPMGVVDNPFNPLTLALGAGASFVARAMDKDPKHLREILLRTQQHKGTSFLEIYQNCIIFNDGVFDAFTEKTNKAENSIFLQQNQPLLFGKEQDKGIIIDGLQPKIVYLEDGYSINDLWIHDEQDAIKATLLARMFDLPQQTPFPRPFGVLYSQERETYEDNIKLQIQEAMKNNNKPTDLDSILKGNSYWEII